MCFQVVGKKTLSLGNTIVINAATPLTLFFNVPLRSGDVVKSEKICVWRRWGVCQTKQTGLSPRRLRFVACVKPKVTVDFFLRHYASSIR